MALIIGVIAGAAPRARAEDTPADRTFSLNMQAAPVADVIRYVATASGASLTADGDVTGTITLVLPSTTVKAVLDRICQAKGYAWWRDEAGGYVISAHPRQAETQPVPALTHSRGEVTRMQKLQFMKRAVLGLPTGAERRPWSGGRDARPGLSPGDDDLRPFPR